MKINAVRSERVVVVVQRGPARHKVFQVVFATDGSLFVTFPYFRHKFGLLAEVALPADTSNPTNVDLTVTGKVTSHLVKYAHHRDGHVHFSQDGKIRTEVRRRSLALDEQRGHMFTALLQGLAAFEKAHPVKDHESTARRAVVNFDLGVACVDAVKVVGRWYDTTTLRYTGAAPATTGPNLPLEDETGRQQNGVAVSGPNEKGQHVLLLTCEAVPSLGPQPESLAFYGGFDPPEVVKNQTRETRFLAFVYPIADGEQLKQKLGCVDFRP